MAAQKSISHIVGLLLIVFVLAGYFFYVGPMWDEVSALSATKDQKVQEKDTLNTRLENYQKLEKELAAVSEVKEAQGLNAIPQDLDQHLLINNLVEKAEKHKMTVGSLSFGGGSGTEFGVQADSVTMSLQGDYQRLVDFLKSVENELQRKVIVKTINVQLGERLGSFQDISFTLSMEVYFQNPQL